MLFTGSSGEQKNVKGPCSCYDHSFRFLTLFTLTLTMSSSLFSLQGKHALVTGGTRGIGAGCARALAEAGATVVLAVRPGTALADHPAVKALPGSGHSAVECDLADMESVKSTFDRAVQAAGGRIDVLVNCGGIQRRYPAAEFPEEEWDEVSSKVEAV